MNELTVRPLRSFLFDRTLKTAKSKPFPAPRSTALQLKSKGLVQIVDEVSASEVAGEERAELDKAPRRRRKPKGGVEPAGE